MPTNIGTIEASIRARTDRLRTDARQADGIFRGIGASASNAGAMIGRSLAIGGVASAAVISIGKIGLKFVDIASDAEETGAKFDQVFKGIRDDAVKSARVLTESYAMSNSEAKKLLSNTADVLIGRKIERDQALKLSTTIQKLAADLASYNNLQGGAARASEIITKAILGERDGLVALGVKLTDADVKAEALKNGQEDLTGSAKDVANAFNTINLIMGQTEDAQGDLSRNTDTYATQVKTLQSNIKDLSEEIGKNLIPMATKAVGVMNKLFEVKDSQKIKKLGFAIKAEYTFIDRDLEKMEKYKQGSRGYIDNVRSIIYSQQHLNKLYKEYADLKGITVDEAELEFLDEKGKALKKVRDIYKEYANTVKNSSNETIDKRNKDALDKRIADEKAAADKRLKIQKEANDKMRTLFLNSLNETKMSGTTLEYKVDFDSVDYNNLEDNVFYSSSKGLKLGLNFDKIDFRKLTDKVEEAFTDADVAKLFKETGATTGSIEPISKGLGFGSFRSDKETASGYDGTATPTDQKSFSIPKGVADAFMQLLKATDQYKELQEMASKAFQKLADALGTALQPLFDFAKEALPGVADMMISLVQVIGKILLPAFKILGEILKGSIAASLWTFNEVIVGTVNFLIEIINGVIKMINWALPKKWEIKTIGFMKRTYDLGDAASTAADDVEGLGDAAEDVSNSLFNLSKAVKLDVLRARVLGGLGNGKASDNNVNVNVNVTTTVPNLKVESVVDPKTGVLIPFDLGKALEKQRQRKAGY